MTERARPPRFLDALAAVQRALERIPSPSMIIGGVAVIAHGVPRFTADVDAAIAAGDVDPSTMLEAFGARAIQPRIDDALEFADAHQVLLLRHEPTEIPVDISFAWLPFEHEALASAVTIDYAGVPIRIPRPGQLIVYKIIGGRPRDLDDAEKLWLLHRDELDVDAIRTVLEELSAALESTAPLDVLQRLREM